MYTGKRVLLIAGGGTLGTYVSEELLRLGAFVEVICPEEKVSDHERLLFHQGLATEALLEDLFGKRHYDGIVDFLLYETVDEYKQMYRRLIPNTDHLIFLSSYRVYADAKGVPITEDSPRLYDAVQDRAFLEEETYAVPKSQCEDFLRCECQGEPWTIVRPVISFSCKRLDLLLYSKREILTAAEQRIPLKMPSLVKDFGAGIDWAGNSGKLIAHLLFKKAALGETYTVYSGHGMTWGEVALAYQETTGVEICWCDEQTYLNSVPESKKRWMWYYDRRFDRRMDASKILAVTGLQAGDFQSIPEGIRRELAILQWKPTVFSLT